MKHKLVLNEATEDDRYYELVCIHCYWRFRYDKTAVISLLKGSERWVLSGTPAILECTQRMVRR